MKKTRLIILILASMLAITSAAWLLAEGQGAGSTTNGYITEYPIPTANSAPQSIVVQSSGIPARVWFTMPGANAIGNLVITDTNNFSFKTYTTGISPNSSPYDLVYDAANNLVWFTESTNGSLGRLNVATGTITEIDLPSNHAPLHLDMAPDGRLYITSPSTNHLVRYAPSTTTFTLFPYDATGGNPTHVAVLNNNSIWVTSPATNRVAELRPASGTNFIKIPVQDFGLAPFAPSGLTLDNTGPWITAASKNWIGRYAEGTLSFWRWYVALSDSSGAGALDYTSSSNYNYLWFVETNYGRVGRMSITSGNNDFVSLIKHGLSGTNSQPTDIVVDSTGTAWITGKGSNVIAQWKSPYANYVNLPAIMK